MYFVIYITLVDNIPTIKLIRYLIIIIFMMSIISSLNVYAIIPKRIDAINCIIIVENKLLIIILFFITFK